MKNSNFLKIITPINLEEEEAKFIASKTYNPIFKYFWTEEPTISTGDNGHHNELIESMRLQDGQKITELAQKRFSTYIDPDILTKAKEIIESIPIPSEPIELEIIADAFRNAIELLGVGYEVVIVPKHGFYFRPYHNTRKIYISYKARLEFFSVDGAVKHELTHVIRYVNGQYNGIKKDSHYLSTEEGLASYMQDFHGKDGVRSLFQHAAEYVASDIGMHGTFRDIYDFFISLGFSSHLAWQRAARHKFGFVDTATHGDLMKPAMYFFHENRIELLSEEERWKLFVGKISLKNLPAIAEYKGLISLKHLKEFYAASF